MRVLVGAEALDPGHGRRRSIASVDDVPDQLVRTPLQRSIQIMKRHRDVMFNGGTGADLRADFNDRHNPGGASVSGPSAMSMRL